MLAQGLVSVVPDLRHPASSTNSWWRGARMQRRMRNRKYFEQIGKVHYEWDVIFAEGAAVLIKCCLLIQI